MTAADDRAVLDVMREAFEDLDRRMGITPHWPADDTPGLLRMRHLAATDPGGVWVAEHEGRIVGCSQGILREGLWGLSLLIVAPAHQGTGLGRELLRRALAYGEGARGGIILATGDPRAIAAYHRAGFALRPTVAASGDVRRPPARPASVRDGRWPQDRDLADAASRAVRTAAHGDDVGVLLAAGARLLVHEDGGFAVTRGEELKLLAATRDEAAADLLRAALAGTERYEVDYLSEGQDWAIRVLTEAGLDIRPSTPVFTRGEVGPLRPYVPGGAYL